MQYDPIKRPLGKVFNSTPLLRIAFYKLLDLLLLRSWHIRSELKKAAKRYPLAHALDAGSGFGQYVYFLSSLKKEWKVTGLDVKQEQIDDCNRFFQKINRADRVTFQYADLTQYVKKNHFDLILSVDVMEHIEEDETVFSNFFESLKPSGLLLISTPSDQGGSDTHDHHDNEVTGFIDEHVRDGYNINDIKQKLHRAGFTSIEARYSYGTPGKISWLLSMKYPILMVNFSKLCFLILPFYYLITYPVSYVLNWMDLFSDHRSGTGLIVKAMKE